MTRLATKLDPRPCLSYGTLEASADGQFSVLTDTGRFRAVKAASCLLTPWPGDTVLLSIAETAPVYVLAVLEQADPAASRLDLPGDATIQASGDLHLAAMRALTCSATRLTVGADEAALSIVRTSFIGTVVSVQAERIKSVFATADQVYRDLTQRIGAYFRATSEHEEIHANSSRTLVAADLSMQAKNTLIVAEENVKIDGELVHLG
ncbi:DUF3540 domain-containing protein [uncultured Thiodictyon sp.]|uniref:DUF3540 domain-containing protein n=1 Tax=uncultured Thiodictyon sp. TaxID=1846217 RepID=UPI0025F36B93|nr:DUF3540 domain-containing protein [uncultured Thiodictyon sp.]